MTPSIAALQQALEALESVHAALMSERATGMPLLSVVRNVLIDKTDAALLRPTA